MTQLVNPVMLMPDVVSTTKRLQRYFSSNLPAWVAIPLLMQAERERDEALRTVVSQMSSDTRGCK